MRPPPWEGLDARISGRILLVLGIAAGAMYIFMGYFFFSIMTNPTMAGRTLYWLNIPGVDNPVPEGSDRYFALCGLFVLSSFLTGAYLSYMVRKVNMKRIGRVCVMTMVVPVLLLCGAMFVPVTLEIMLFIPPAMMLYAASLIVHPENRSRPFLVDLGVATVLPMLLALVFSVAERPRGAAMLYIALLAMGICAIYLSVRAREEHLKWLRLRSPEEPVRPAVRPPPEPSPEMTAAPPRLEGRRMKPAHIIIVASLVLSVVFFPPVWVLDTNPDLELYWQVRTSDETGDIAPDESKIMVEAMVINRGAAAAVGVIKLVVHNDTGEFPVGAIDGMQGFGSWYIKKDVYIPNKREARRNITISLIHNGQVLDTQIMRIPDINPALALAAIVVIKAILDRRRGRR